MGSRTPDRRTYPEEGACACYAMQAGRRTIPDEIATRPARFPEGFDRDGAAAAAGDEPVQRRAPAAAHDDDGPRDSGRPGRRYVIRGGHVMSMDPAGRATSRAATCWSRARRSSPSGRTCSAGGAAEIDARGRIVMPGFIDTHHHQFETALRSFLADGILINDGSGSPSAQPNLLRVHPAHVRAGVPAAGRVHQRAVRRAGQLDDGVTTVHDVSQIHHSPQHSDAAIQALLRYRAPRRLRLFRERARGRDRQPGNQYPADATRIKKQWFSSSDQLVTHDHGRRGLPWAMRPRDSPGRSGASSACRSRRTSCRRSASARSSTRSPPAPAATVTLGIGPDNLFIHMTGMSDPAWQTSQGRRRAGLARLPDRDEHAPRHAADPQDAAARHGALAQRRRRSAR